MACCQKLYEGGHITYMRTDSCSYSKEFIASAKKNITNKWGEGIRSLIYFKIRDKSRKVRARSTRGYSTYAY